MPNFYIAPVIVELGPDKENLVVKVNATNPLYQIDLDADVLLVGKEKLTGIDLTLDITASGANGLDVGSEAADTWYSTWVIYNPVTKTIAGLLSTSSFDPTLPSGYTEKRRVGWVRNDGYSNFVKFYQMGNWWMWDARITLVSTSTPPDSFTDLDCKASVPPTSNLLSVNGSARDEDSCDATLYLRRNGATGHILLAILASTSVDTDTWGHTLVDCDNNQIIEYHVDAGDNKAYIYALGYYDPV